MGAVRTQPIKEGGECHGVTILQMAGLSSWTVISEIKNGGRSRSDRCTRQSDIINLPNSHKRPAIMAGFQNTKHSEVQIQVDTDPQVTKVDSYCKKGRNK